MLSMESFIRQVRASQIKHPTQKGFSADLWQSVAQSKTHDSEDRNLAQAGLFVFEELDALRNELDTCFPPSNSRELNLRYFVGFENRTFRTITTHFCSRVAGAWLRDLRSQRSGGEHLLSCSRRTRQTATASEIAELIAPRGRFGVADANLFASKSVLIHLQLMFTRSIARSIKRSTWPHGRAGRPAQ
jgi:hypothetical protein